MRNCALSSHPDVYNRAQPLDLAVFNAAPSFFIDWKAPEVRAASDDGIYWYDIGRVGVLCLHLGQQKLLHKNNRQADPSSIKGPTAERQACSTGWIYLNNNYGMRRWVFGATVGCGSW